MPVRPPYVGKLKSCLFLIDFFTKYTTRTIIPISNNTPKTTAAICPGPQGAPEIVNSLKPFCLLVLLTLYYISLIFG